jgi:hypothetical protein
MRPDTRFIGGPMTGLDLSAIVALSLVCQQAGISWCERMKTEGYTHAPGQPRRLSA